MTNHVSAPVEHVPQTQTEPPPPERPTASPPGQLIPLSTEECLQFDNLQLRNDNLKLRKQLLMRSIADMAVEEKMLLDELDVAKKALAAKHVVDPARMQIDPKARMVKVL